MVKECFFTNMEQSPRTGLFSTLVPFSTGEVQDVNDLRNNWTIDLGGNTVSTFWHQFGAPHRDGSVRFGVADFVTTIPAGSATYTWPPTMRAEAIQSSNIQPNGGVPNIHSDFSQMRLNIEYTDPENNQFYTRDIISYCLTGFSGNPLQAGTNHVAPNRATWRVEQAGGKINIYANAFMGRGRHHEHYRLLGHNNSGGTGNPPVEVDGLLHVRLFITLYHEQDWGYVTIELANDAPYPFPSEPPDGSPNPTRIPEPQLIESPLARDISNLRFRWSRADGGSFHARPWYVNNYDTGAGPWGDVRAVVGTNYNDWIIPIGGLADGQCWGSRWSFSRTTAAFAEEVARKPFTYRGSPSYQCWHDSRRQGGLVGNYSGINISMSGWDNPLLDPSTINSGLVESWYAEGLQRYNQFMGFNANDAWDLLGAFNHPGGGGGNQRQFGFCSSGRQMLGSSVWDLYNHSGQCLREYTCRGGVTTQEALRTFPPLTNQIFHNETIWIALYKFSRFSRNAFGRFQIVNNTLVPSYQAPGNPTRTDNPDPNGGNNTTYPTSRWEKPDWGHIGERMLHEDALMRQDPWAVYRTSYYGDIYIYTYTDVPADGPGATFQQSGNSPRAFTSRGEHRSARTIWWSYLLTGETRYRDRLQWRLSGYRDPNRSAYWQPVGGTDPIGQSPCNILGQSGTNSPDTFVPWQSAFFTSWAIQYGYEFALLDPVLSEQLIEMAEIWTYHSLRDALILDLSNQNIPTGMLTGARDHCWSIAPNLVASLRPWGYLMPRNVFLTVTAQTTWRDFDIDNDISRQIDYTNGGENDDWSVYFSSWRIFPSMTNDPAFSLRAEYIVQNYGIRRPNIINGTEYDLGAVFSSSAKGGGTGSFIGAVSNADFVGNPTTGQAPLAVLFDSTASFVVGNRSIATFEWWFEYNGDPQSIPDLVGTLNTNPNIENPTHIYNGIGIGYNVRLRIVDENNSESIKLRQSYIFTDQSQAILSSDLGGKLDSIYPATKAASLFYSITGTRFDAAFQARINHFLAFWTAAGGYIDDNNQVANRSHLLNGYGSNNIGSLTYSVGDFIDDAPSVPQAAFIPIARSYPSMNIVDFTDLSEPGSQTITSRTWDFGDGTQLITTDTVVSHTYPINNGNYTQNSNSYTVTLTVTNSVGNNSISLPIVIEAMRPLADFTSSASSVTCPCTVQPGTSIQFTDQSRTPSGSSLTYLWEFTGAGDTSTLQNPTFTYNNIGVYSVSLTVTNSQGNDTLISNNLITVSSGINASFTFTPAFGPVPLTVNFTDTSSPVPSTWEWNFGDGSAVSNLQNPSHIYTDTDCAIGGQLFTVTLTVDKGLPTEASFSDDVGTLLPPVPTPDFVADQTSVQAGDTVTFDSSSTVVYLDPSQAYYLWFPIFNVNPNLSIGGFGNDPNITNLQYTYDNPGVYDVGLLVGDECFLNGQPQQANTELKIGYINVGSGGAPPTAGFTVDVNSGSPPLTVNFTNTSTNATSYLWDFGDGSNTSTDVNPTHVFQTPGSFTVLLTAINSNGQDTFETNIIVNSVGSSPIASFSATPLFGFAPLSVQFTDTSSGSPDEWLWEFGDGSVSTLQNPLHVYNVPGVYDVVLIATNNFGSNSLVKSSYIQVNRTTNIVRVGQLPQKKAER